MIIHTEHLSATKRTFCCDLCGSDFEVEFTNRWDLSGTYYEVASDVVFCNCLGCNRTYEIQRTKSIDGKEYMAVVKHWDGYSI